MVLVTPKNIGINSYLTAVILRGNSRDSDCSRDHISASTHYFTGDSGNSK